MGKRVSIPYYGDLSQDSRLDLVRSCIADAERNVATQQGVVQDLERQGVPAKEAHDELARRNFQLLQVRNHGDILSVLLSLPPSGRTRR